NRYELYHELLYDAQEETGEKREETVKRLMQSYVSSIEKILHRYPYNWFNFYDYWGDRQ
ncbi:hypothetical protein MNBD_GAMMA11-3045, partial [hydrothermal vent metagenome]